MKIIAFAGSNSEKSINKELAKYASSLFEDATIKLIDLNNYEVTIYGIDKELKNGIPRKILELAELIKCSNLLILSLAEHNGTYSVAFKNVYDWLSRIPNQKVFNGKPILLMATSPGERGGASVLKTAQIRFTRDGSEILNSFSLPNFRDNFKKSEILDVKLRTELIRKVNQIKYKHFKSYYKDNSFTCGIDPTKDDCGDAIEY
jgi:NAD(P)H-dependent FMN reductase